MLELLQPFLWAQLEELWCYQQLPHNYEKEPASIIWALLPLWLVLLLPLWLVLLLPLWLVLLRKNDSLCNNYL